MKVSGRISLSVLISALFVFAASSQTVAQSVAGACLYALDPTASQAFYISGNPTVSAACSIVVESSASNAFAIGGTNTVYLGNHAKVGVVGGWQLNGSTLLDKISNQPVQPVNITSPGDPLSYIQAPTQGTIVASSHTSYNSNHPPANNTISPGVYCGGLAIGSTDKNGFKMSPGIYIMAGGGFSISSQAVVTGSGVTIYNSSSAGWGCSGSTSYTPITVSGQASVTLSAPSSGSLLGILMFGDRTGCATVGSCQDQISGQSATSLNGALYFKSDTLLYNGNSPNGTCLAAVADKITLNGNASFGSTGCAINPISVSITPPTASLYAAQTQQFTAAVTNSYNNAVTWSIAPSGEGSISSTGLYTAPGSITANQTVTVTATSQADTTKAASATVTLLVPKVTPTITWPTPAPITYGTPLSTAQLDATANVPGTFAYLPSGGTVLSAGTQTLSVTFTPTDTIDYTTATASVQLVVNKATPPITWATPAPITYGTALSATQLNASSSVQGSFVYSPAAGEVPAAGTQTLSTAFTPSDTADYTTATATVHLTVNKATPVLTWAPPAAITYGTAVGATQLDATASVPGTFAYSPAAGTVLGAGTQSLSVSFTPNDSANYGTATATVSLTVNQATPTLAWTTPAPITFGTALSTTQLNATANVQGSFVYTPTAGTVLPAGNQTLSVTFTPTDTVDYTTATDSVQLNITAGPVTISLTPPIATVYAGKTLQLTPEVKNTSNQSVSWSMTPPAGVNSGSIDANGVFTAPAIISSQQTVIVTATSQQDPAASASSVLTLASAKPDVETTANAGTTYLPKQTVNLELDAKNGGSADAASTTINVTAPDGSTSPLSPFPLPIGQTSVQHATYLVPAMPPPSAPQPLPPSSDATLFNVNLIVNGNAEGAVGSVNDQIAPTVPGWTRTDNFTSQVYGNCCGFPLQTDPGPANRGTNFFYGGPSSAASSASQIVDVSGAGELIDTGLVKYSFSAWLGGFSTQDDHAVLTAAFQDSGGNTLSTSTLGPVTPQDRGGVTGLLFRSTEGLLPPGTRAVNLTIVMTRFEGSDNDGYADNFSFVLTGPTNSATADPASANYLATLASVDDAALPFQVQTAWTDASGTAYGPLTVQAQAIEVLPIVSVALTASSSGISGSSVQYTATLTNTGHSTASGVSASIALPDGSTQALSLSTNSLAPQQSTQATTNFTVPVAQQGGPLFARAAVSWSDSTGNSYGPVLSTASSQVVQLAVLLQNANFVCAPATPGPYIAGTTQTFIATLTDSNGRPVTGINVSFNATGANTASGAGMTDAKGRATFAYTGPNIGTDDVQASISLGAGTLTSNGLPATWVSPAQTLSTTPISATFFAGDSSGIFNATTSTPVAFTQSFPTIGFGPPVGVVPNDGSSGLYPNAPFTDVTTDIAGNFSGIIPTRAGSGTLAAFQGAYTGSFLVKSPGDVTFTLYSDSGFVFGVGNGAVAEGGPNVNAPQSGLTAFAGLQVMGANNQTGNSVTPNTVIVNFPQPGNYPYELDYATTGTVSPVLTLASSANSGLIVPPAGALKLTPISETPEAVGNVQAIDVQVTDAMGNLVANQSVTLAVTGANPNLFNIHDFTDSNGNVSYSYTGANAGVDVAQATSILYGNTIPSNSLTVQWGSQSTGSGAVTITSPSTVTLPNSLLLTGTITGFGTSYTTTWSRVSGPGTITFDTPSQSSTHASFSNPGVYVIQLSATAGALTTTAQTTITVNSASGTAQGWIGSPLYGATVSGIVPITVTGVTLQSGILTYYPANAPNNVVVLNSNTSGSGQIGTFDTTTLANGSYWITLQATDTSGESMYNLALVTVVGSYKPGRLTTAVTDLVVPANGLAIKVERRYDSLNAAKSSDFGYGWSLGTKVDLSVSPRGDVTFTLGGVRRTFYLTPQFGGWFLPYYFISFTPEQGLHGTLTDSAPGCADLFDFVVPNGNLWSCLDGGIYNPSGYVYTDPSGTSYTMSAGGDLQSIRDKNGNTLTVSSRGITSSSGPSVQFQRDGAGRITQIVGPPDANDPNGVLYKYGYDSNGNLTSVTYPPGQSNTICGGASSPNTSQYKYDPTYIHYYSGGTDAQCNPLPTTTYSTSGRLASVTDAAGNETDYAYDLNANATNITYPPDPSGARGHATLVYDNLGDLLSSTDPLGNKTTNTYENQNLTSTTDPLNHTTCYKYDGNGNRTSVSYPGLGTCTTIVSTTAYNQLSEPTSTVDELGNVRTFAYDANFAPLNVSDALGTLAGFKFNANGTMASGAIGFDISTAPAKASRFIYDADGNMICRTDALGRSTSYSYDSLGHEVARTEPQQGVGCLQPGTTNAGTTGYKYDAFGNLIETDAPLGRTTKSVYDNNGNKISDTDARSYTTKYTYDALNRLIRTDYPDGTYTTKSYDFRGNVIDEKDQAGNITHHVYDLAGRLTSLTAAYSGGTVTCSTPNTTCYTYYDDGRKQTETDALGHTTSYTYNIAGDLTGVSGVNGTFSYGYDNAHNRTSMTDGKGNTTGYVYDARKRLIETDYPDAARTKKTNAYDGPGNLISVVDQAGNEVDYTYDAANQLQSVVQTNSPNAPNNITSYSYDPLGNLMGLNDANNHLTESNFDLLSQQKTKTLPDGSLSESRLYDVAGNLVSLTHFNGKTTTYTYDNLNRLQSRIPDSTTGEPTVSFTYTPTGKRQKMTDASGETDYAYDSMDRLITKVTPEGTLTYGYDAAGHLQSITSSNPGGTSVSYTYDTLNRLSTVVDGQLAGNQPTSYQYDPASNVNQVTYANGVQYGFNYDELNRLTQIATQKTGYLYAMDAVGNRQMATELDVATGISGRTVNWNYDGIYRLTSETISLDPNHKNGGVSYSLDPVGNRLSALSNVTGVPSVGSSFDPDDQLMGVGHDSNGNITQSGVNSFSFDSENQLVSMNGGAVQIVYDGDGNRVRKTVNGVTTSYLVDDLNPTGYPQVVEELTNGAVSRTYTYGLQRISESQFISGNWTPSFYGYDGFGTVRQLTSSTGIITDTYDYDAFGNKVNSIGTTPNNYLYRGEQFDTDLGLYYLRARYYNPITGRFMSRDPEDGKPVDPKTLQKYLYAAGDPVNRIDPSGRDAFGEYLLETIGHCTLQTKEGVTTCTADKIQEDVNSYLFGNLFNGGFNTAKAFGKSIAKCINQAFTGIANVLNQITNGEDPSSADLNSAEALLGCLKPVIQGELGAVVYAATGNTPDPPEF